MIRLFSDEHFSTKKHFPEVDPSVKFNIRLQQMLKYIRETETGVSNGKV